MGPARPGVTRRRVSDAPAQRPKSVTNNPPPDRAVWADRKRKARRLLIALRKLYGRPRWTRIDGVSELVGTILSQNTNDGNRDLAYTRLRARFPSWEQVRDAPVDEVIDAIRPAGLANQKGPRIQAALRHITQERGRLNIDFLQQLPVDEARRWLLSINGIGPKTAAIVLLFCYDMPAFPVDTHVHRVARRLGLIDSRTTAEQAHTVLEALCPDQAYAEFHLNLIRHGREICHARSPACERCPLQSLCWHYQGVNRSPSTSPAASASGTQRSQYIRQQRQ